MEITEQRIAQLREAIERKIGRTMQTPKNFDFLSEQIYGQLHETVSASTLKRLWGYLPGRTPRLSSLDILSRFVGYKGWEDWTSPT